MLSIAAKVQRLLSVTATDIKHHAQQYMAHQEDSANHAAKRQEHVNHITAHPQGQHIRKMDDARKKHFENSLGKGGNRSFNKGVQLNGRIHEAIQKIAES